MGKDGLQSPPKQLLRNSWASLFGNSYLSEQPLLGPGYQGADSLSHLKLNPQLLLCTLSGVGLREEVAFRIQRSHGPRLHVEEQGPVGSRTVDKSSKVSGSSGLKSRRGRRHTLVFYPVHHSSPGAGMGPPGMLK